MNDKVFTCSGVVPESQCLVLVQEGREGVGVCEHSSDVGGRTQCPDHQSTITTGLVVLQTSTAHHIQNCVCLLLLRIIMTIHNIQVWIIICMYVNLTNISLCL